jgi:hypothetical protein
VHKLGRLAVQGAGASVDGSGMSVGVLLPWRLLLLLALVYMLACRLLQFVVLLGRSERSRS